MRGGERYWTKIVRARPLPLALVPVVVRPLPLALGLRQTGHNRPLLDKKVRGGGGVRVCV